MAEPVTNICKHSDVYEDTSFKQGMTIVIITRYTFIAAWQTLTFREGHMNTGKPTSLHVCRREDLN